MVLKELRENTNCLELELICPQNGSAVLKGLRENTNYLEVELISPQNGAAVRKGLREQKLLGIRVILSPKRECGSKRV